MVDILGGQVLDLVDGDVIELAIEGIAAIDGGGFRAREWVLVDSGRGESSTLDDEMAASAVLDRGRHRVPRHVRFPEERRRLIGEIEILGRRHGEEPYGMDDDGE